MLPDLHNGDKVLVLRYMPYSWLRKDWIVVFKYSKKVYWHSPLEPSNSKHNKINVAQSYFSNQVSDYSETTNMIELLDEFYIKRIKALESETYNTETKMWNVPTGHLFVQGDNLKFSTDSRHWGPISYAYVIGVVIYRFPNNKTIVIR